MMSTLAERIQFAMDMRGMTQADLARATGMRHSFATACLHAGMNIEDLSRMLGHSDINTTFRRYVKPDLSNIREGLAKIPYPE